MLPNGIGSIHIARARKYNVQRPLRWQLEEITIVFQVLSGVESPSVCLQVLCQKVVLYFYNVSQYQHHSVGYTAQSKFYVLLHVWLLDV